MRVVKTINGGMIPETAADRCSRLPESGKTCFNATQLFRLRRLPYARPARFNLFKCNKIINLAAIQTT
ncbi:hypothetical protein EIKCOROL_01265 [Eikenella corrodens ATCC 23834]|uniref:Uncharacterized protein n=1 Tax=Eikenella corrodens ATCC 23834 TaxID=546274 RepID=C0DV76_EIKCO|nr:hypothetical protein EIKCOROL_01265 [Eikenella corrodens ATCC 23834]